MLTGLNDLWSAIHMNVFLQILECKLMILSPSILEILKSFKHTPSLQLEMLLLESGYHELSKGGRTGRAGGALAAPILELHMWTLHMDKWLLCSLSCQPPPDHISVPPPLELSVVWPNSPALCQTHWDGENLTVILCVFLRIPAGERPVVMCKQ